MTTSHGRAEQADVRGEEQRLGRPPYHWKKLGCAPGALYAPCAPSPDEHTYQSDGIHATATLLCSFPSSWARLGSAPIRSPWLGSVSSAAQSPPQARRSWECTARTVRPGHTPVFSLPLCKKGGRPGMCNGRRDASTQGSRRTIAFFIHGLTS